MAGTKKDLAVVFDRSSTLGAHVPRRLIAVEIRPSKTGFVVFEGRNRLLDWGVCTHSKEQGHAALAGKKIAALLDLYSPAVFVVRRRDVAARQRATALGS